MTAAALSVAAYASSTLLPWRGVLDLGTEAIWRVGPSEVALTFDDGPDPEHTPRILDVLAHARSRATFFLIGSRVGRAAGIVRRILDEGHAVGNHTRDHQTLLWRGERFIEDAIVGAQRAIFDACGASPRIVRAPFGRRDGAFYRVVARLGLTPVFWSRDTFDWTGLSETVVSARLANARGGDIVLMHDGIDGSDRTRRALASGLPRLSARALTPRRILTGGVAT